MSENIYLLLFANCFVVKGKSKSVIFDSHYNNLFSIPNDLCDFIDTYSGKLISNIKKDFNIRDQEVIDEYISFLDSNDLLNKYCTSDNSELFNFSSIDLTWDYPAKISNGILEISEHFDTSVLHNIINQLSDIGCKFVEVRIYELIKYDKLIEILKCFNNSRIKSIFLYTRYNECVSDEDWSKLLKEYGRIYDLVIHGSPIDKEIDDIGAIKFNYICQSINNKHCGNIKGLFNTNLEFFTESLHFNNCLNRKISIDTNGNIKNCPSMMDSYGNIRDTTLAEAIEIPEFKKYWDINKDRIYVCKDCEFRYICTDCRAYIEEPEDILSKPLKCGYNPYSGEWSEWSTNPLKQKAIDYYGMIDYTED